jgi:solute carrier family 39 (zinc transporter), member 9
MLIFLLVSERLKKESTLGFIVFLAILLHKAPGAIGFGTFLQHAGLASSSIAKHLLAFTLACPVTSVVTYEFMTTIYANSLKTINDTSDDHAILFWVGILLIISAGSFIYVSTLHILPEVLGTGGSHDHHHGHVSQKENAPMYPKWAQLACMIVGLVAPLGLTYLQDE